MIEQCRWVGKSQILDRPSAAVGVSSSREIGRWPNSEGAAPFLRRISSFGPAGGDWLRKRTARDLVYQDRIRHVVVEIPRNLRTDITILADLREVGKRAARTFWTSCNSLTPSTAIAGYRSEC